MPDMVVAGLLLAFAAALVGAALYASVVNWRSVGGATVRYDEAALGNHPAFSLYTFEPNPDANVTIGQDLKSQEIRLSRAEPDLTYHVRLFFTADRLLPTERVLEGRFMVLWSYACNYPWVSRLPSDEPPADVPSPAYVLSVEEEAYLLRCDGESAGYLERSIAVRLPLTGVPQAYPSDLYVGVLRASLSLATQETEDLLLPPDFWIEAGAGMEGTSVMVAESGSRQDPGRPRLSFAIGVERDQATRLFTYAMALIPFAVALLLFYVLFLARPNQSEPIHHLLLNVAAAMIAVLPLRQVLVPPEITGLTRIDLLLGIGLVVIIALALIRYAWYIRSQGTSPIRPDDGGKPPVQHENLPGSDHSDKRSL